MSTLGSLEAAWAQELYNASKSYGFDFLDADEHYFDLRNLHERLYLNELVEEHAFPTEAQVLDARIQAFESACDFTRLKYYGQVSRDYD